MSRFPKSETEIVSLAHSIITGLTAHPDEFPKPPVTPDEVQASLNDLLIADDDIISLQTRLTTAINHRKEVLQKLIGVMRSAIHYAEQVTTSDNWSLIGWSARAERTALQMPGQVRNLVCSDRGIDWIKLSWSTPMEGGKVAVYHVQNHDIETNSWQLATTAFTTEITLNNLPRAKNLEFRIEAANKEGAGLVSNTLSILL